MTEHDKKEIERLKEYRENFKKIQEIFRNLSYEEKIKVHLSFLRGEENEEFRLDF